MKPVALSILLFAGGLLALLAATVSDVRSAELYDLQTDPDEVHNLADDPKHRLVFERMVSKLKNFQRQTADPWQIKWTHE